jgi:hypothetical protein
MNPLGESQRGGKAFAYYTFSFLNIICMPYKITPSSFNSSMSFQV